MCKHKSAYWETDSRATSHNFPIRYWKLSFSIVFLRATVNDYPEPDSSTPHRHSLIP